MRHRPGIRAHTLAIGAAAVLLTGLPSAWAQQHTTVSYAVSQFGPPLYGPDFAHFDSVNPDAPKGGSIVLAGYGDFDTLNDLPLQGQPPTSLDLVYDSLMVTSGDELTAAYGQIAATAEYPDDLSWITFAIRPEARWQDGTPITADDVVWTFDQIRSVGNAFLKAFYDEVDRVEALDPSHVRFDLKSRGRMSPLLTVAKFRPLPQHWWEANGRDIGRGTLEPVLGSGAYRIAAVEGGRSITYERVPDYWGAALPVDIGQNNIDRIRYDYYRDYDVMTEAFLGGGFDLHQEYRALSWNTRYDVAAVHDGLIRQEALPDNAPQGMQALFINLRRPMFQDIRVRQALTLLFDFETTQRQLLYGEYLRTESFFPNSDFASAGPPSPEELAVLEPFRDQLPAEVFTATWAAPATDGTGNIRPQLREALSLLAAAGWELRGTTMTNMATGEPMHVEILADNPGLVRLMEPYIANLRRAGIAGEIRLVDPAQAEVRRNQFDYDLLMVRLTSFMPPGSEQRSRWGSSAADEQGSSNFAGIRSPVVDALIQQIVAAPDITAEDYAHLVTVTRALDRVLLWGSYVIPEWYNREEWIAYWDIFGRPERQPKYDLGFPVGLNTLNTWWIDPAKAAAVAASRTR